MLIPLRRNQLLFLLIVLLVFNSCNDPSPKPGGRIILVVNADSSDPSIEQWFFVTNGSGAIVDYKRITGPGETVFTETSSLLNSRMNVYSITLFTGLSGIRNCLVSAYLNIKLGQQWYYDAPDGNGGSLDADHRLNATVVDAPTNALVQLSTGPSSIFNAKLTTTDLVSTDDIIDTTKIQTPLEFINSNYTLTVYSRLNPMYARVKYSANNDSIQRYNYPKDFVPFEHTFSVPTGKKPNFVLASGFLGEGRYDFIDLDDTTPGLMETIDAGTEVKLCYRDGFDYYRTYYTIDNRSYYHVGGIPAEENVIIPSQNITVDNTDLWNFKATHSSAIDYRTSIYSLTKTVNGVQNYSAISVSGSVDNGNFDLSLPQEFKSVHPDIDFSSLEYNATYFMDSKAVETYDDFINREFKIPGSSKAAQEIYSYLVGK